MRKFYHAGRFAYDLQFVRFLLAGFVNAMFGYSIYLLGLLAGARPEVALLIATVAGAVFNYFTTGRLAFAHRDLRRLPLFVATYGVLYVVNAAAIRGLIGAGLRAALAQATLVPLMAVLSFLLFRFFVFRVGRQS